MENQRNHRITLDVQLKTALYKVQFYPIQLISIIFSECLYYRGVCVKEEKFVHINNKLWSFLDRVNRLRYRGVCTKQSNFLNTATPNGQNKVFTFTL